ncbi:MAG: hypothetical protein KIS96_14575 [Bauldia sp.]|nr:hypothetical protein [Bauldia sp.]
MIAAINPKMLSRQQLRALDILGAGHRLYRRRGYWGDSPHRVSLDVAGSLQGLGLTRIDRTTGPHPFPVLTGAGRDVFAVIEQRRQRA